MTAKAISHRQALFVRCSKNVSSALNEVQYRHHAEAAASGTHIAAENTKNFRFAYPVSSQIRQEAEKAGRKRITYGEIRPSSEY